MDIARIHEAIMLHDELIRALAKLPASDRETAGLKMVLERARDNLDRLAQHYAQQCSFEDALWTTAMEGGTPSPEASLENGDAPKVARRRRRQTMNSKDRRITAPTRASVITMTRRHRPDGRARQRLAKELGIGRAVHANASAALGRPMQGRHRLSLATIAFGIFALSLMPFCGYAQQFPNKPIRFVVGSAPGSGNDLTARMLATRVSESWGQQIVVENRAGGGQIIAAEIIARAAPDGYSLLQCGVVTMSINPALYRKLSYQPLRDFTPITSIATAPNVLVIHPSVPAKRAKELVAYVLAHPGKFNYGSGGIGSTLHLSMEMFRSVTGMKMTHIPYKGGGLAMVDLYANQILGVFQNLPVVLGPVKAGKVHAIGVTSAKRSTHLPDVPTFVEAGYPSLEITVWYGACAPAGVPGPIVTRINDAMVKVLNIPEVKERFVDLGVEPAPSTPQAFAAFIKSEGPKWTKAVQDSGTTPQ